MIEVIIQLYNQGVDYKGKYAQRGYEEGKSEHHRNIKMDVYKTVSGLDQLKYLSVFWWGAIHILEVYPCRAHNETGRFIISFL